MTVCTEGDCQLQNFSNSAVWCDNYKAEKTCSQTEFHGIEVDCDDGACEGSRFVESTSTTCRGTSCQLAHFDRSIILCLATSDCDESTSFASQLTMGGYATISDYGCNCCDGSYCPETASSCITNPTGFCRSTYLGAMCKEWGNPVCENIPIETSGKTFTACTQGSCSGSVFSGAAVLCDNTKNLNLANTCNAVQVTSDSSLICQAGACSAATVSDSWVVCNDALGGGSCQTSSFSRSRVDCFAGSCSSSNYVASQVLCETSSCIDSTFDTCSCCEGYSCPEVSSCTTLDLAVFCLSCASNPICGRSFNETLVSPTVPTIIVPTASVPTTTSSTNAPAAATLPTVVPVSIPSPTGQTPTSPTGGATPPIAGPSLGVQVLKTSSGQSVDVVPPLGGGTVAAVDQPLFGSLTTKPDGTITYVPTETFVGTDRFTVKRCNANSQCEQVAIVVEVTEPSSSKGLYGLAALALIPIIGVILFLFRKKLGCASPTESALGDDGKPTGVVSDAANAGAVVSQSLDAENPSATTISSITNPGQQRASQSDPPGSAGSRPTTTNMDIGPHEPRASEITPVNACKKGYLPDNKDQCRSVALSDRNATPLVHAVIMHDDDDNREEEDDDDDKV